MVDLARPGQGTKNWHEDLNENFEIIEQELNDIDVQQFDQSLNTDDDVTFDSVTADNLKISQWNTAYDRSVTDLNLSGDTIELKRANSSTLSLNIGGAAGSVPSGFIHDFREHGSFPGSGTENPHDLGVKPWGIQVWAVLQVSRGGWSVDDRIDMSSHFESGNDNYSFIVSADDENYVFTSRESDALVLSDKDGSSGRSKFSDSEVKFEVYLWAWDIDVED